MNSKKLLIQGFKQFTSQRSSQIVFFNQRFVQTQTPSGPAYQHDSSNQTQTQSQQEKKIDFGFKEVKYEDKEKLVGQVFNNVAESYDVMNDAMSLGVHRLWKDTFVDMIGPLRMRKSLNEKGEVVKEEPLKILDVAGGTGDISFRIHDKAMKDSPGALSVNITVSDINPNMLDVGKKRAIERGKYHVLNAEQLESLTSVDYDLYTIAFGIRNVTDRNKALREAYRILRKGGRFMCLEFSEVQIPGFKQFYDFYSLNVIPPMGKLIANDAESYQYLVESIRKFPKQTEFAKMIEDAGFKVVTYTNLTGGIVAIHSGFKI